MPPVSCGVQTVQCRLYRYNALRACLECIIPI